MSHRRQLAELRADRDIYLRYLNDCGARRPDWGGAGDAFREGVVGSLSRLHDALADIEQRIARLEAGGAA